MLLSKGTPDLSFLTEKVQMYLGLVSETFRQQIAFIWTLANLDKSLQNDFSTFSLLWK